MEKIYPYGVSKIRAKETKLLTKRDLESLASEENIKRIVSVLKEKGYDFDSIKRYEDYELVLKKAQEGLYSLAREVLEDKKIVEIFLCENDYYNMKLILKSKIEKKDYIERLNSGGIISKEDIIDIMEKEEYEKLDNITKNAIQEAKEIYQKTKMPFVIDAILDKACFYKMRILSEGSKNEFILKYIEKVIDTTNIKTFFRIRKIYKDLKIFEISYIQGGKINLKNFIDNIKEDNENLKYKFSGYSNIIEQAIYNYENIDRFCDNYIMNYMKEAKLKALTIEPILAYIYAKITEFKNIRIIFTGKLNNICQEKIKERLRESYV